MENVQTKVPFRIENGNVQSRECRWSTLLDNTKCHHRETRCHIYSTRDCAQRCTNPTSVNRTKRAINQMDSGGAAAMWRLKERVPVGAPWCNLCNRVYLRRRPLQLHRDWRRMDAYYWESKHGSTTRGAVRLQRRR